MFQSFFGVHSHQNKKDSLVEAAPYVSLLLVFLQKISLFQNEWIRT